ncbi:MATE efflux family protein [Actinidia rufa]|uniref:Protein DETOXIFICATION n=1 Tax=Actinidia rufa TaxID=165716 RepID=A0A7J0GQK6_9ERIC|nr:MATE efflux family protein [Actinidia rufa]
MDSQEDQYPPFLAGQAHEAISSSFSSAEVEEILARKPVPVRRYPRLVGWESRLLWLLSWASIIVALCNYMLSFVSLTFSGQLGAVELAGASIAMLGTQGLAYGIMEPIGSVSPSVAGEIRRRIGWRRTRGGGGQRWSSSESAVATSPSSAPALSGTTPSSPSCRRRTSPVTDSARSTPASAATTIRDLLAHHHRVYLLARPGLWPLCISLSELGMASAVQTVCGQAYGAKQYASMGIVCQRAIILHVGAAVLLTLYYWYFGEFLELIGQSESTIKGGRIFARGMIPQLYAFAISCPIMRFLQAQNIVNPLAMMSFGVLLLHIFLTWAVVSFFGYGLLGGASLTLSFSWWVLVGLQGLYVLLSPSCKKTWTGFSVKAVYGIWPYFKLTLASAVMLCLEIWYNQGLVLISGLLPNPTIALDSLSICLNYWTWDIEFMLGLSAAVSVRVGNELGAGHPMVARFSMFVVIMMSILISIFFTAIVVIFKVGLSRLFTSDIEVIEAVSNLTPLLAISVFLNGVQPILSGVAIGSGWQAVVAYVNLFTYYVVGLPIGCVLGFKTKLAAAGIWWGMVVGVLLQTVTLIFITARTNWNAEVAKAAERLKNSANEEPLDESVGVC